MSNSNVESMIKKEDKCLLIRFYPFRAENNLEVLDPHGIGNSRKHLAKILLDKTVKEELKAFGSS